MSVTAWSKCVSLAVGPVVLFFFKKWSVLLKGLYSVFVSVYGGLASKTYNTKERNGEKQRKRKERKRSGKIANLLERPRMPRPVLMSWEWRVKERRGKREGGMYDSKWPLAHMPPFPECISAYPDDWVGKGVYFFLRSEKRVSWF